MEKKMEMRYQKKDYQDYSATQDFEPKPSLKKRTREPLDCR
jgi:hypothetical protein